MKAIKSFGQHFLTDPTASTRMLEAAGDPAEWDRVIEIGPGQGALTNVLYPVFGERLTLIEIDRRPIAMLREKFPHAEVVEGDFLQMDLKQLRGERILFMGNFPYNISSQILFRVLEEKDRIGRVIGMFQREVAERVIAPVGSRESGVLSVFLQSWYEGRKLFDLGPEAFDPPPKVHSSVIVLNRNKQSKLPCDEAALRKLVKQAFGQRRKMLRSSLKPFLQGRVDPILTKRPEQLELSDLYELTNWVFGHG